MEADPEIVRDYATDFSVAELAELKVLAREALQTSQIVSRSVAGQAVTIDPSQAEKMLKTFIAAQTLRTQMDETGESADAQDTVRQTPMSHAFNFGARWIE